jgi:quercetin dioxygenase-like cupin family protein
VRTMKTNMQTKLVLVLSALILGSVLSMTNFHGTALATPPSLFMSTVVGPTQFDEIDLKTHTNDDKITIKTTGLSDVYNVTNIVNPGGYSGWHSHPGPTLVSVKSGTATVYHGDDPDCTPHVIPAQRGFVEPAGLVHIVRNEGAVDLELHAFQVIPQGAARRIDQPDPGNCSF